MTTPDIITVTDAAASHMNDLMKSAPENSPGLIIGVKAQGCSGMKYYLEYAAVDVDFEDKVMAGDIAIYIDPTAVIYILGTEVDYEADELEQGFVFNNPNESSRCGCGESFHLQQS